MEYWCFCGKAIVRNRANTNCLLLLFYMGLIDGWENSHRRQIAWNAKHTNICGYCELTAAAASTIAATNCINVCMTNLFFVWLQNAVETTKSHFSTHPKYILYIPVISSHEIRFPDVSFALVWQCACEFNSQSSRCYELKCTWIHVHIQTRTLNIRI